MNKNNFGFFNFSLTLRSGLPLRSLLAVALLLGGVSALQAAPSFGPQSSTRNVQWNFDFVEQFDDLQDWRSAQGNFGDLSQDARLPKLADGSDSAWNYYASFVDAVPSEYWIRAFGDQRVWRGTKSAAIDLGGAKGPSQLGLSLGAGYTDFHLFFMVNIPKNAFPTHCAGGNCQDGAIGSYTAGQPYTWFASWPLLTFNSGCDTPLCGPSGQHRQQTLQLKPYDYGLTPGLTLALEDSDQAGDLWALDGNSNLDAYLGGWFAFELHVTQSATETLYTVWVYEPTGKATTILDHKALATPSADQGKPWSSVVFGGAHRDSYTWGSTMKSEYFIDDVIIDDQRIGPKYFRIVNGMKAKSASTSSATSKPSAPAAPSGFKVRIVQPAS